MIQETQTTPTTSPLAARYRQFAATLEHQAADKHANRLSNTPKRALQASAARIEGDVLARASKACTALANGLEAGTLPDILKKPLTKTAIVKACETKTEHPSYYTLIDTGIFRDQSPVAVALRELLTPTSPEELQRRKIKDMEEKIRFANILGFFPTPPDVIQKMIDAADLTPGMLCLEPSAGKGDIAEALRTAGCEVELIELNRSLVDILDAKGFDDVDNTDFLFVTFGDEEPYDRVILNPPFENRQDAAHVQHAFDFLRPGGRLVAIVSNGTLSASEKKCVEFREWLEANNATIEELPKGSFKDAFNPTGVSVSMVVIDKTESAKIKPENDDFPLFRMCEQTRRIIPNNK